MFYSHRLRITNTEYLQNMITEKRLLFELFSVRLPLIVVWNFVEIELIVELHAILTKPPDAVLRKFYGPEFAGRVDTKRLGRFLGAAKRTEWWRRCIVVVAAKTTLIMTHDVTDVWQADDSVENHLRGYVHYNSGRKR